jgi:hypothetical protein
MLRRLEASLVLALSVMALPARAQEPEAPPASEEREASPPPPPSEAVAGAEANAKASSPAVDAAPVKSPEVAAEGSATAPVTVPEPEPGGASTPGWKVFVSGYFRAPLAIGISHRTSPDDLYGAEHTQLSFGPNRTVDSNYYSFAYTRLQEQDWVELFVHAKKKHVEAVVGWMGYWFQGAGFRNPDAAWVPAAAYLALDTDFNAFGIKPNIMATVGAFWPQFGYFAQYDTFTLGRFRQIGEQLKLTVPVSADVAVTAVQGFGTGRDGTFVYQINPPIYGAKTGIDLVVYEHLALAYKKVFNVGLHHNSQWTMDPNLFRTTVPGKAFTDAREAHLTTIGAEASVDLPRAGRLWVSPSYITVKNGWALANGGTEVMHSLGGDGIATNYFGWSGSLPDSTGSGSMLNVGFNYENTLSSVLGKPKNTLPDVKLSLFGLFADIKLDLPATSKITQDHIGQFKYGASAELQALSWVGLMLRFDEVNYNLGHGGYVFSAITPRLTFSSHFLSGESIYLQYSRYRYGDEMMLAGTWPWGTPLVAGSDIIQGGPYGGQKPDMDVVRVQATVAF